MKIGVKLILVTLMTTLLIGVSCTREQPAPLRIGTNVWPGYEPIWLAHQLEYYRDMPVTPVAYQSTTDTATAFRNKEIDAAAITLDEALTLAQFDPDFTIVLILDVSNGADVILGKTGLMSLKDLKGKRIGVETTGVCAYTLSRALESAGMTFKDVRQVNMNFNEHEAAFKKGVVDAVVTYEPVRTILLKGGARQLFDSSHIPNEILDVVIVRREYLRKYPDVVSQFIRGWFRALAYMKEHPKDAAERVKTRMNLSAEDVLASYRGLSLPDREANIRFLTGEQPAVLDAAKKIQTIMLEQRLLLKKVDAAKLIDTEAAGKLYKSLSTRN